MLFAHPNHSACLRACVPALRSADVAAVKEEIARHRREMAEHMKHIGRSSSNGSGDGSSTMAAAERHQTTASHAAADSPSEQHGSISAVPIGSLAILTTIGAVNERWQIGPRAIGVLRSGVNSPAVPSVLRHAMHRCLKALTSQGTAVAIGVATGCGAPPPCSATLLSHARTCPAITTATAWQAGWLTAGRRNGCLSALLDANVHWHHAT